MKIVIGTSRPFHLFHLARELSEVGHEVVIVGYMPRKKMKQYDIGNARYKSYFFILLPLAVLALQRNFTKLQKWATFSIMPFIDVCISRSIKECDLFIGLSGVCVKSLSRAKKIGAVAICERGSAHINLQSQLVNMVGLSKNYIRRELLSYKNSDFIMLPSLFALNSFLLEGFKRDNLVINNYGVDLKRFVKNHSEKANTEKDVVNVLFVGGWSYQKGADIMIDVLEDQKIKLSHIGSLSDMPYPKNLKNFAKIGHIPNSELPQYYKLFDVLILPSRQDGFGMVLLEALACGLTVIASKNTGGQDIKNVIEDKQSVLIMEDLSSKSLKEAIHRQREWTRKNSVLLSENDKSYFTWKAYGKRYDLFIQNILNKQ